MKNIIIILGLFLSLTSYTTITIDKITSKDLFEKTFEFTGNSKLTTPAEVRRSNIDFKSLSAANRRGIPSLEKDTIYSKINFSKNSKITKSDFLNIVNNYNNYLKKLKNEGFYKKGVSGIFISGTNQNDTLFFEYNHIKITNDNIKCLLRVHIVFDAIGSLKDGEALRVLDIRILSEEQKPQFSTTEKENIIKQLKNFGEIPPPPPTNSKKSN